MEVNHEGEDRRVGGSVSEACHTCAFITNKKDGEGGIGEQDLNSFTLYFPSPSFKNMFCQERELVGEHEDEQTLHLHNPNTETLEPLGNIYLFILPFLGACVQTEPC